MNDLITAIVGTLGVLFGAMITCAFQYKLYKIERKEKLIETRKALVREIYTVFGKMPAIREAFVPISVTGNTIEDAQKEAERINKERGPLLGQYRSEVFTICQISKLYFGDNTQKKINDVFFSPKYIEWWNIPDEELRQITEAMLTELEN